MTEKEKCEAEKAQALAKPEGYTRQDAGVSELEMLTTINTLKALRASNIMSGWYSNSMNYALYTDLIKGLERVEVESVRVEKYEAEKEVV